MQAGCDFQIARRWHFNGDLKCVWMDSDLSLNGANLTKVDLNPWLSAIGVDCRFWV